MSTSYPILENKNVIFVVDEHSNLLDLRIDAAQEHFRGERSTCQIVADLTPAQVVQAACAMLTAASYWMGEDEFDKAVMLAFANYCPGDSFQSAITGMKA